MHHAHSGKNRLAAEKSPYLLQHAGNPVDWYPWGDTATQKARQENKPIFVSIGYSTCHWCHVMAHESFADEAVADRLNRNFVAIKVDREERPDIDAAFMHACHLLNGHGGWPLNLFLTPMGQPFYAFTYLPKEPRGQHPGLIDLIDKITELWATRTADLIDAGKQLARAIKEQESSLRENDISADILERAAKRLRRLFDPRHAGFGGAPKFPQPHTPALLLRLAQRFDDPELQDMALETLNRIDQGGITDQLGGGIHRYSTDEHWLVPHFEKMLYDQALISDAYLDAWQVTAHPRYRQAAEDTLDYVLRTLQHPEGGFYCGEDADSEGAEGTYYLWSSEELETNLTKEEKDLFTALYNPTLEGNFEGRNILYRQSSLTQLAADLEWNEDDFRSRLAALKNKLRLVREQRPHPHLDDKILTGWNGLMIAALARAGSLLQRADYIVGAEKAMAFITTRLEPESGLKRRYREGEAAVDAFHEDYAYLIRALIELFLATADSRYLQRALQYWHNCAELFTDGQGGLFDAAASFADGVGRGRSRQDGATPAAASVTAHNLIRLARLTGDGAKEDQARRLLALHLAQADEHPTAFAFLLQALDLILAEPLSLAIVHAGPQPEPRWRRTTGRFRPHILTLNVPQGLSPSPVLPWLSEKHLIGGRTTAWLCTADSCLPPITAAAELERTLNRHSPLKTFSK